MPGHVLRTGHDESHDLTAVLDAIDPSMVVGRDDIRQDDLLDGTAP